ncbi:MAG: HK97 family phage prohead protease, partial [Acidimicrobiia bacterium]
MTENSIVYRALAEPLEFPGSDGLTLEGYAAVFDRAAHIEDHLGSYDEVIKPGAFTRSINARKPFLLYQHGRHPLVGQFPLGTIETLREDSHGLFVRARLVDTWITQPVRDGIRDRAITGMSVAMESPRNQAVWSTSPGGTKLRTVREAKLYELGPVLGPAYADTTVALRSMLD